nr:MAG TPA: hypothetical protein [Crassvirales sp.]
MMTVLLACSTISSSRNYSSSSTGGLGNDSVKVAISDIRRANVKLVQLKYEQEINANLKEIIRNDSIIIYNKNVDNKALTNQVKKLKKQRNIGVGAAIGSILLFIISIIK